MDSHSLVNYQKLDDRCLGAGAFGTVYLGINRLTGEFVAIKEIPLVDEDPERPGEQTRISTAIRNEVDILCRAGGHPNLVKYIGFRTGFSEIQGHSVVQMLMEYVTGGSLSSLIVKLGRVREQLASR